MPRGRRSGPGSTRPPERQRRTARLHLAPREAGFGIGRNMPDAFAVTLALTCKVLLGAFFAAAAAKSGSPGRRNPPAAVRARRAAGGLRQRPCPRRRRRFAEARNAAAIHN